MWNHLQAIGGSSNSTLGGVIQANLQQDEDVLDTWFSSALLRTVVVDAHPCIALPVSQRHLLPLVLSGSCCLVVPSRFPITVFGWPSADATAALSRYYPLNVMETGYGAHDAFPL
jgi:valyl-tRNA synthetase